MGVAITDHLQAMSGSRRLVCVTVGKQAPPFRHRHVPAEQDADELDVPSLVIFGRLMHLLFSDVPDSSGLGPTCLPMLRARARDLGPDGLARVNRRRGALSPAELAGAEA